MISFIKTLLIRKENLKIVKNMDLIKKKIVIFAMPQLAEHHINTHQKNIELNNVT